MDTDQERLSALTVRRFVPALVGLVNWQSDYTALWTKCIVGVNLDFADVKIACDRLIT